MRFVEAQRSSHATAVEFDVSIAEEGFGYAATCPRCQDVIEGTTQHGTVTELANHLNERHFQPPRGNA